MEFESQIITTIQDAMDRFGWFGVSFAMAFENATGITPTEIILSLAGWMLLALVDAPPWKIFLAGLYAALGSTIGSSLTYWLARLGGRPLVDRAVRAIRLDARYVATVERMFQKWGPGLVFFGRMLPGVRTLINIPAGLARISYLRFFVFTFLGTYVWCTSWIGLGFFVGHEWTLVVSFIQKSSSPWLLGAALILGVLVLTAGWLIHQRLRLILLLKEDGSE
jgi:membrane protein DedA with SNARE-associated domain